MDTDFDLETVARHFIIAALWADCPEGTRPRETKAARKFAAEFCRDFIVRNRALFDAAMECDGYGSHPDAGSPEAAFGHDLYLTCAEHGAGFWARPELGDLGDKLTDSCRASYVTADFYRGWMYLSARIR